MNRDNTYKQIEGRNQVMQFDSLKVLLRSTLTPTSKVGGRSQKGFVLNLCVVFTMVRPLVFITQKLNHIS